MPTRGAPIQFKRGKYKGRTGWLNDNKTDTRHRAYIIVTLEDGTEKETWVKHQSITTHRGPPRNFSEAMLQQHPDIEGLINQLCFEVAHCNIAQRLQDPQPLYASINERLNQALHAQSAQGSQAI
jgi:hypothetical protein